MAGYDKDRDNRSGDARERHQLDEERGLTGCGLASLVLQEAVGARLALRRCRWVPLRFLHRHCIQLSEEMDVFEGRRRLLRAHQRPAVASL